MSVNPQNSAATAVVVWQPRGGVRAILARIPPAVIVAGVGLATYTGLPFVAPFASAGVQVADVPKPLVTVPRAPERVAPPAPVAPDPVPAARIEAPAEKPFVAAPLPAAAPMPVAAPVSAPVSTPAPVVVAALPPVIVVRPAPAPAPPVVIERPAPLPAAPRHGIVGEREVAPMRRAMEPMMRSYAPMPRTFAPMRAPSPLQGFRGLFARHLGGFGHGLMGLGLFRH